MGAVVFVISLSSSQAQIMVNGQRRGRWIGETSPEGVRLSDIRNGLASFGPAGGASRSASSIERYGNRIARELGRPFFFNAVLNGVTFPR